jgi:histidinol-phosphate phosphatase family protein
MAGGKGTRLYEITNDEIPKPMVLICGKPILEWQIESLKAGGITEIMIITGHLGEVIHNFFGSGERFGVNISYYNEETPLGSAGALTHIGDFLTENDFLLVFGDTIFDIDISRMIAFHREKACLATLFVHPNSHPHDSDLVKLDGDSRVTAFDSKESARDYWYGNLVNAGFYILSKEITKDIPKIGKSDLEKDVLLKQIPAGNICGYYSTEYIKDVGTVKRIKQTEDDLRSGVVAAKNLSKKQKCVFLDRDGTINRYCGLIYKAEDMELWDNAADAVAHINRSAFLAVVVTNQPVVARGLCGIADLEEIHNKMKTLLGRQGAYVDDIFYCPHHPDKGYPEENPAYKIPCECRKPNIGMITAAAERWNIDVRHSWMVGDSARDIKTAKNAGLRSILVKTGECEKFEDFEKIDSVSPDHICGDLSEAVALIMRSEQ